ncbi:heparan-alpha-glucosaminide N-acetyltransferase domain-containing protein [Microbacterium sp. C7(2022)]|uniref:heparan-alpha-glucosaminide N-acetyltransferase domain-containing protein n=1 Tax=Microbacterium sp. C7(2022) TaxID=2992759 RepID=UPI00237BFD4F|nr:heparan-alpha-glucosaminide N-acetyltransferase domain-containing protein [Microbacterium sp. C7(2022)]MDE0545863.1 DUF1624 domain-containing protein [Microbacterium sp. C7(2022)]
MTPGAGGVATRWRRLNGEGRVQGVDLARGLAVIGMLAAHLLTIEQSLEWLDPNTWIAVVNGRSSILFATLAGVSIALVTGGAVPLRGERLRVGMMRLVVRAFALWMLGVFLIFAGAPVFVILPAYALMFLIAVAFVPLRARTLAILAAVIAVVMPFVQVWLDDLSFWATPAGHDLALLIGWHYPFTTWIAFVFAGMALGRADVRRLRTQIGMLVVGATLCGIGALLAAWTAPSPAVSSQGAWGSPSYLEQVFSAEPHSTGLWEAIGSGGFALAVIGACLLLCRTIVSMPLFPLRALGAMPLTAYTAQIVAWAIAATAVLGAPGDLMAFRATEPFWAFTLITIAACTAWALLVGRGPLEWALDRLSRFVVRSGPGVRAG